MKIYTSYFAKAAILRKAGIVPIGVALWPPRFFRGISMKQVAPRRYMLDDRLTDEEYIRMYRNDVLRLVDARSFIQDLERASRGMDVALCCFENRVTSATDTSSPSGSTNRPALRFRSSE